MVILPECVRIVAVISNGALYDRRIFWTSILSKARRRRVAETEYSVYIVRCGDDTYYTGISQDVARRIVEHDSSPRGAKYLKGRGPLTLVFSEAVGDRSAASRIEYRVKRLDRSGKEALIRGTKALQDVVLD